jgi:ribosome biogenesis GTPase / thiamine phosphate phosphatase
MEKLPTPLMSQHRKKPRDKQHNDLADRYRAGDFESQHVHELDEETGERFSSRSKNAQQNKILRTALLRIEEQTDTVDLESLPIGQVTQVYSLYCEVEYGGQTHLCVVRKTLSKVSDTQLVVGDYVRFRDTGAVDEAGRPAGVVEQVLPRKTVLTRTHSFKGVDQHPIVANAQQMLIVASVRLPRVKWGLIDRMIAAARSGGLSPIICLNKMDLLQVHDVGDGEPADDESVDPLVALAHYQSLDIRTLQCSVIQHQGLDELRDTLKDQTTVLAGHSGVGKSSLINAIQPTLDIRVGDISHFTDKGRHTTSSARRYLLDFGGVVIDTPGVKMFGLWGVSRESLIEFFPDVADETAPPWRVNSYQRILKSIRT